MILSFCFKLLDVTIENGEKQKICQQHKSIKTIPFKLTTLSHTHTHTQTHTHTHTHKTNRRITAYIHGQKGKGYTLLLDSKLDCID